VYCSGGSNGIWDRVHALDCNNASISVGSSCCYLSPNSPPRRATDPVAISSVFGDLSVGLYLSKRNGRLGLLLFVGFSRYGNLIVSSRVPNRKFEILMSCYIANLTTQSATTGWNTSCTQATNGFNFSQRGMTLNYAGNPNAASTPQTKSP
jgi:hypothetical protein